MRRIGRQLAHAGKEILLAHTFLIPGSRTGLSLDRLIRLQAQVGSERSEGVHHKLAAFQSRSIRAQPWFTKPIYGWWSSSHCNCKIGRISLPWPRNSCAKFWLTMRNLKAAERRYDCKVTLDEAVELPQKRDLDLLALDPALKELARVDSQRARIVELRFFGGRSA